MIAIARLAATSPVSGAAAYRPIVKRRRTISTIRVYKTHVRRGFDFRQIDRMRSDLAMASKETHMAQLFGTYFPYMVVIAMLSFMLVLGGLSIEEAWRGRKP